MDSVDAIISAFGGVSQLGEAIGATPQAVSNMRARRSIPARYWRDLIAAAAARGIGGVTYESLAAIAARARRRSGRAEAAA